MEWIYIGLIVLFGFVRLTPVVMRLREERLNEQPTRQLFRQARQLGATRIAEVPEATVVRVVGEARPLEHPLPAPISKRPCLRWQVTVSVLEYGVARRGTYWQQIFERSDATPFVLEDDSGTCLIDPAVAAFSVGGTTRYQIKRGKTLPADVADFLEGCGLSVYELYRKTICIDETVLAVGAKAAVAGVARMVPRVTAGTLEQGFRTAPPVWACMDGRDAEILIGTDRRLLHRKARSRSAHTPLRAWGQPAVAASRNNAGASAVQVDEFEGALHTARRRRLTIGAGIIASVLAVSLAAMHSWSSADRPTPLTTSHREMIANVIRNRRKVLYLPDVRWKAQLEHRVVYVAGDQSCPEAVNFLQRVRTDPRTWPPRWLYAGTVPLGRAPIPITLFRGDKLPERSPWADVELMKLQDLESALDGADDDQFEVLSQQANRQNRETTDVLVELDPTQENQQTGGVWFYDHAVDRITCAGALHVQTPSSDSSEIVRAAVDSLHAVRMSE